MSRVINTEGAGKDRNRLVKGIVIATRELMKQTEPDSHSYDLVAFISLALGEISSNIDVSVAAWEKRGYWVKADHFRMEWAWSAKASEDLRKALLKGDWGLIALTVASTAQKFSTIKVSEKNRLGKPWEGAWNRIEKNTP
jgi:hypothetical protein